MIISLSIYLTGFVMFLLMLIKEASESDLQFSAKAVGFLLYVAAMWFIMFPMYLVTTKD